MITRTDATVSVFQCRHKEACERRINVSLAAPSSSEEVPVCAAGYTGVMCGVCAEGYTLGSDDRCTACETTSWHGSAAIAGGVVVVGLLAITIPKWYGGYTKYKGSP